MSNECPLKHFTISKQSNLHRHHIKLIEAQSFEYNFSFDIPTFVLGNGSKSYFIEYVENYPNTWRISMNYCVGSKLITLEFKNF